MSVALILSIQKKTGYTLTSVYCVGGKNISFSHGSTLGQMISDPRIFFPSHF